MNTEKILQQNATHKAVDNGKTIGIYIKGFEVHGMKFPDELLYSIPKSHKDDLFAIFERFDEDNRINVSEANEVFKNAGR